MSTISASTTSTTAYKVTADTTGALVFQSGSGPTTAMTIDTSQNVGIGTSSPVTKLTMAGTIAFSGNQALNWNTYFNSGDKYIANGYAAQFYYDPSAGTLRYLNAGNNVSGAGAAASLTDRFAIDSSGNVGIGTSSPSARVSINQTGISLNLGDISSAPSSNTNVFLGPSTAGLSGTNGDLVLCPRTNTTASVLFYTGNGTAAERARIDSSGKFTLASETLYITNIPTTSTAGNCLISSGEGNKFYRSTSSLKYKRNVVDMQRGLADVQQLRPVNFNGISDFDGDKLFAGFIAEEVEALGFKEFVIYDENGEPDGLQYANLTALLTKAIQEQQALITQLQADVAALKGAA